MRNADIIVGQEVKNLELLKLRFGDLAFRNCDVMLRDVEESQHLDASSTSNVRMNVLVISEVFWPTLRREHVQFHSFQLRPLHLHCKCLKILDSGASSTCFKNIRIGTANLKHHAI